MTRNLAQKMPRHEVLAMTAVALLNRPYLESLGQAWVQEHGATGEAVSDFHQTLAEIDANRARSLDYIAMRAGELSVIGQLKFALALRRFRREALRAAA